MFVDLTILQVDQANVEVWRIQDFLKISRSSIWPRTFKEEDIFARFVPNLSVTNMPAKIIWRVDISLLTVPTPVLSVRRRWIQGKLWAPIKIIAISSHPTFSQDTTFQTLFNLGEHLYKLILYIFQANK